MSSSQAHPVTIVSYVVAGLVLTVMCVANAVRLRWHLECRSPVRSWFGLSVQCYYFNACNFLCFEMFSNRVKCLKRVSAWLKQPDRV